MRIRIIVIRCSNCGTWNSPKIDENDKPIYPKGCVNKHCRTTSYMKDRDTVYKEKVERMRINSLKNPNHHKKNKVTISEVYNGKLLVQPVKAR